MVPDFFFWSAAFFDARWDALTKLSTYFSARVREIFTLLSTIRYAARAGILKGTGWL